MHESTLLERRAQLFCVLMMLLLFLVVPQRVQASGPAFLVKDINPISSAYPQGLTYINDTLFFTADDGTGWALWRSNGTASGTFRLKTITPLFERSTPPPVIDSFFYFFALDRQDNYGLWRSDGTAEGTNLVKSLFVRSSPSGVYYPPDDLMSLDQRLFFRAGAGDMNGQYVGSTLWTSDGTSTGTHPLTMMVDVTELVRVERKVYFAVYTDDRGGELWMSDGTVVGTTLVKDLFAGTNDAAPQALTPVDDAIFFTTGDIIHQGVLWHSDGTAAGTTMLKTFTYLSGGNPHVPSTNGVERLTVGDGLIFFAGWTNEGWQLWKSDGTETGTVLLSGMDPLILIDVQGTLFFSAYGTGGSSLWKSQGHPGTAVLVKQINLIDPAYWQFHPRADNRGRAVSACGTLFFTASDRNDPTTEQPQNWELWRSDGTITGTTQVQDIASGSLSATPEELTAGGELLFFRADDGNTGRELWAIPIAATINGTPVVPPTGRSRIFLPLVRQSC